MLFTKTRHFITLFFAILYSGVATSQTIIFNFHVKKEVMRMKQPNGWDNWAPLGTLNEDLDQNITINLDNKQLLLITRFQKKEPSVHKYKIIDVSQDQTYDAFGLWILILTCQDEQSQQSLFRLGVVTANNQKFYTLIQGYDSETIQTKDELEVK